MKLLVCVMKESRRALDDVLAGFLELDIKGATIVDAMGMAQVLTADISLFSGLRDLFPGGTKGSLLLLSVVEDQVVPAAVSLIKEVLGDIRRPGTGLIFTLPVDMVQGLALPMGTPERGAEPEEDAW
jgi:nitrogen regulatory protein P-II 1